MSMPGSRHMRRTAAVLIALAVPSLMLSAPPLAASARAVAQPARQATAAGPAERQLSWLISAAARAPLSAPEIERHLAPQYLTAIGGPATVNQELAVFGKVTLGRTLLIKPSLIHAIITTSTLGPVEAEVQTDPSGQILITEFLGASTAAVPTSWQQLDTSLRALAPQVSFAAMTIGPGGSCHLVHGVNASTARPLGSAFKLYVLGALGQAIRNRKASWGEKLAIREQWKSLPSGVLQNDPAGTTLTLREYADFMLSLSDNTAADRLIHFLGRDAVQAQLARFGNQSATRNIPFLTTRELFDLRGVNYPVLAKDYLADSRAQRTAELAALDKISLSQVVGWTQPEMINQIEWFASPEDICRAYAGLWRENAKPGMSGIGGALSINDGDIGLSPARYPLVWFKGGSEPGVVTLNYLAHAADGRLIVSSVMLADPGSPVSDAALEEALALARGGIQLATR
jgi:beta-lactamase class A